MVYDTAFQKSLTELEFYNKGFEEIKTKEAVKIVVGMSFVIFR